MDKKKKILSLSAIALVGGIVALSATGGIGNLKSDSISGTWIDTGDGNGYYSYEEDPGNTGNSSVPSGQNPTAGTTSTSDPLSEQINLIASQVNTLEGDENREGSIAFLQKKIRTLQSAKIQLQKDVDAATKNLDAAKALKEIKIDIYDCTKDSKYKGLKGYDGNGYIYRNPETYLKRIGESTVQNPGELYTAIQNFDTQIAAETNATTKKTLENKRKLAQDERTAGRLSKVVTCYQNAVQKSRNADSQIALYQPKYDTAIAALQKNTDDTTKAQSELADGQNKLPSLKTQLLELKKQQDPTYVLALDENTEGSIKYLQKKFDTISADVHTYERKLELAEKALKDGKSGLSIKIDIYACTKDSKYKGLTGHDKKGYVYKNPSAYTDRITSLASAISSFSSQIATAEGNLSRISKTNTAEKAKQVKNISDLTIKKKLAQDEQDALQSYNVKNLCYNTAVDTLNKDKVIVTLQAKYDEAKTQFEAKTAEAKTAEETLNVAKKTLEEANKKKDDSGSNSSSSNNCGAGKEYVDGQCLYICGAFPNDTETTEYASCDSYSEDANINYVPAPNNKCDFDHFSCTYVTRDRDDGGESTPKSCDINQPKPGDAHCEDNYWVEYVLKGDENNKCSWQEERTCAEKCAKQNMPKDFCSSESDLVFWRFNNQDGKCEYTKNTQNCGSTYHEDGTVTKDDYSMRCIEHEKGAFCGAGEATTNN